MTPQEHTLHTALNRSAPVPEERPGAPYLEIHSMYAVHNRYLRIALMVSCVVILLLSAYGWRFSAELANRKPIVIRVNSDGDAMTAPYSILDYKPREPEIRHFLNRFIIDHYSLIKATARDAFQRKLFYLTAEMARAAMDEERRTAARATFMASGTEEADVEVLNVAIEQLEVAPYKATITFDKVFRTVGTTHISRRERYVAHCQFKMLDRVPNTFVPVNPLGLVVTYLRQDQAFDQLPPQQSATTAPRQGGGF
jgi:type IV secretory pathway TrbF-like protein